jgi:hypothetical protein
MSLPANYDHNGQFSPYELASLRNEFDSLDEVRRDDFQRTRAGKTHRVATALIRAANQARAAKTAYLKELRLAKEAADDTASS